MTKLYLFDIEGTTTDINFVHKVLFPYSEIRIRDFILNHKDNQKISVAIKDVQETILKEDHKKLTLDEVIDTLIFWIHSDRKHPALKEIQGHIWDIGYSKNDFKGHVYGDVQPFFMRILNSGEKIGIYSSGSVHAQKLIFGYSEAGDLTPMISYYFDTQVGGKREETSYSRIAHSLKLDPMEIHFFSDIPEELSAAESAGFKVTHVLRSGTKPSSFSAVKSFDEINF
jgi:enolase-phosphatase E1